MAVRAACASTAFLTATTWATVDTSVTSGTSATYLTNETTGSVTTSEAGNRAASGFTPGAITIDGIGLRVSSRLGTTGTFSVQLFNLTDTAVAAGTLVTVNMSDFPNITTGDLSGGWQFFKFSAPVTLTAAKAYVISPVTSSSTQLVLMRDATANNWSRYLRTTTTGAPAAGDDLIIAGEWTAAATVTTRTVTMDETAATDYGSAPTAANGLLSPGIAIGEHGVLTYGTTAATNYVLRLSNSLIVYNGGTLNIGTTGTSVPRDGSSVLEFDCGADGDYGLIARNGSTVNLQGLSRTSGKNIVSAKLTADTTGNLILLMTNASNTTLTANNALDPTGLSRFANTLVDNVSNVVHSLGSSANSSVNNTTQVFQVWLARGTGTNNRFARIQLGNSITTLTNGFYADIDLQAGTIGSCTAVGTGTATSSSITAVGSGYLCTIVGKASNALLSVLASIHTQAVAGTDTYVGDGTMCLIYYGPALYTASVAPTDLTIDTDTGWLAGDAIAVASTTRTAVDCENSGLLSNAGASTLTLSQYVSTQGLGGNVHSGTSPTQAEVILLTRNVKVRSTSSTLMSYVQIKSGAVVDIDWTEFYYLGIAATAQRGIDVEVNTTGATNFSMQFSSLHDTEVSGFFVNVNAAGGTLTSLVFSSNAMWNLSTSSGVGANINAAITSTSWTFDSNIMLRTGGSNGWTLSDVGGTFTNNTVVGATSVGISLSEAAVLGTMSGNVAHSNVAAGVSVGTNGISGTFGSCASWRNAASGLSITGATTDLVVDSLTAFGNTTRNVLLQVLSSSAYFKSPVLNGDTTFATTSGFDLVSTSATVNLLVDSGDLSTVSGIKTAHTNDIFVNATGIETRAVLRNTKLGATVEVATPSNLSNNGFVGSEKHDETAGNHMTWMKNGKVQTDASVFNTAAPSMLMTPTSATLKLESAPQFQGIKVAVASGATVTIAVYVRKSASYNGNQPRLIQKANPAIGISADVVIATFSAGLSTWAQISGVTAAATDDGVFEFVVDCDGTAGAINVDDWSAS